MMLEHFDAFKSLLTASPVLSDKVFSNVRITDGQPVRDNYVVVVPNSPGDLSDGRLTAPQLADSRARWRFDVRVVSVDVEGLMRLTDAVMGVIGVMPVVAGRWCSRVRLVPEVEEGKARYDSTVDLHYLVVSGGR